MSFAVLGLYTHTFIIIYRGSSVVRYIFFLKIIMKPNTVNGTWQSRTGGRSSSNRVGETAGASPH